MNNKLNVKILNFVNEDNFYDIDNILQSSGELEYRGVYHNNVQCKVLFKYNRINAFDGEFKVYINDMCGKTLAVLKFDEYDVVDLANPEQHIPIIYADDDSDDVFIERSLERGGIYIFT